MTQIKSHAIILAKDTTLGLISIAVDGEKALVGKHDTREGAPSLRSYESYASAAREVTAAAGLSQERGWTIVYSGPPLWG